MSLTFKIIDAIEDLTDAPFAEKEHTHSEYFTKSQLIDLFYPVGSIYTSMNNTNPNTIFGGTWEQITDKFMYCTSGASKQKGGSKKITANQLPAHSHEIYMKQTEQEGAQTTSYGMIVSKRTTGYVNQVYVSGEGTTTQSDDTSSPDDYLPPYITVYAWHRTA